MSINAYSFVGMIGVSLFTPLSIFSLWQGYHSFHEENKITKSKYHHKSICHVFISAYLLLDLAYLAQIWKYNYITVSAFCLHEVAMFMNYIAFNCVIDFWSKTLQLLRTSDRFLTVTLISLISINFLILAIFLGNMITYGLNDCESHLFCFNIYIAELCCNSFCLCFISSIMSMLGIRLQIRLGSNSDSSVLFKLNLIVLSCTCFYLLRAAFVIYLIDLEYNTDHSPLIRLHDANLWWFIVSKWLPLLVPAVMMLYLMRPNKSYSYWDQGRSNTKTITTTTTFPRREIIYPIVNSHSRSISSNESNFYNSQLNRMTGINDSESDSISRDGSSQSYSVSTDFGVYTHGSIFLNDITKIIEENRAHQSISVDSDLSFNQPVFGSLVSTSPTNNSSTTIAGVVAGAATADDTTNSFVNHNKTTINSNQNLSNVESGSSRSKPTTTTTTTTHNIMHNRSNSGSSNSNRNLSSGETKHL